MSQFYPGWADEMGKQLAELDSGTQAKWPKRDTHWKAPTQSAIAERRARGQVKGTKASSAARGGQR